MPPSPPAPDPPDRSPWPIAVYGPGQEPGDDLSAFLGPAERVELVWHLSRRMWLLSGRPLPQLPRQELPIRVIRPA